MSIPHSLAKEDPLKAAFKCMCYYQGEGNSCIKGTKAMCIIVTA